MSNSLLTPNIIAREALLVLENNMVFSGLVHRDYSSEFASVGDTISVRKPATFAAEEWNGSTISIQNATEGSVAVKLDTVLDVSFGVTSKELSLDIQSFSEQFIQPALRAHAQALDAKLAQLYKDIPYNTAVSATPALADLAAIDRIMNVNKVPGNERRLVVDPTTKANYVVIDAIARADASGSTEALRQASMGHIMTLDTFMDQNIVSHAKGDLAGTATLTGTAGATSGTVASGGNAKTIKKGDLFTIATLTEAAPANQFVCTKDMTTDASGGGTLEFYPALPSNISAQVITVKASAKANIAFHRNAFALVTRPLANPLGGAASEVMSYQGMSIRVTYAYNMDTKANVISIDQLVGVKTLTPELAVRFNG